MKKVKETKIQKSSGSFMTVIPNIVAQLNDVEKGDKVEWSINPDDPKDIRVRIIKKQP